MSEKWLVLKFGGSSVRGPDQWRAIAERVEQRRQEGYRVLLVCSAVAGITDLLHQLSRHPHDQSLVDRFVGVHRDLSHGLDIDGEEWIGKANDRLLRLAGDLRQNLQPATVARMLATGEWLSTRLGWVYLQKRFETEWVDARGLLEARAEPGQSESRRWLSAECEPGASDPMRLGLEGCFPVVITQGFIAGMPGGGTALLGRGGSDTSAVLLGGRIDAERVEIWTDVPGLFSADPRRIPQARLLQKLEYAEALEMAASGASVMQPRAVRAAAATRTPVWIRDASRPEIGGTVINGDDHQVEGARAVVCQEGMTVLLLQNIDPRQQVGFLAWVFQTIADCGISIDLVATSETTTTVAINRAVNHLGAQDLAALADRLREKCRIEIFADCVTVNVVGRGVRTSLTRLQQVFAEFENRPLLMVSQSANDLCLSLLVRQGDEADLLRLAHEALIPAGADNRFFGPSWLELEQAGNIGAAAGGQY